MPQLMNDHEASFCREKYRFYSRILLTEEFNREFSRDLTVKQITSWLKNRRIRSGRTGYFTKGNVSTYKPPKGTRNAGSFAKGSKPHNTKPIGYESTGRDGYVWICVEENNPYTGSTRRMRQKHIVIWERENGIVPKGMRLKFLDGVRSNCTLENLMLIEDSVAPLVRSVHMLPHDVRVSSVLVARVEAAVIRKNK